jgi:hypothetical protein
LQLIQVMDGETEQPIDDPIGRNTYYQCADIRIVEDLPENEAGCSIPPAPGRSVGSGAALGSLLALAAIIRRRARPT